jgi:hypothetical protein
MAESEPNASRWQQWYDRIILGSPPQPGSQDLTREDWYTALKGSDQVMERIPLEGWRERTGHCDRYQWAASRISPGETVNDVACGIGYGATFLTHAAYRGYDRPGVPDPSFTGEFFAADLEDAEWRPDPADVVVCFETLEHVTDPARLARILSGTTARAIFVSVPVVPTVHLNGHHLHDFTREDIPPLFPGFRTAEEWAQPEELSHVWMFERIPE